MNQDIPTTASRREFLKNTGRMAGASVLAGIAIPHVHAAENNTIQIALIGCGGRGTGAAADALSVQNGPVKLVAMADVFQDRLGASYDAVKKQFPAQVDVPQDRKFIGFDAYQKAMDCLKPGDVAIFATPPGFRWVHFGYAIRKGLHVFMEKPVAVDGPTTRKMLALGEESVKKNLKVGVGLMVRHCHARQALLKRLQDGAIGDLVTLRAYRMIGPVGSFFSTPRPADVGELFWQIRRFHSFLWASGGAYSDCYIHQIDECCWMKGAWPVKAQAIGARQYRNNCVDQNFDTYSVEYTFPDGTKFSFYGRSIDGCYAEMASYAEGSKGAAVITTGGHTPGKCRIYNTHDIDHHRPVWAFPQPEPSPYQLEWDDLIDAIRRDKPYNEVRRGAEASLVASMGRMAAHTGSLITYDQILNCPHEFAPEVDKLTMNSPAPIVAGPDGKYPVPQPGVVTARVLNRVLPLQPTEYTIVNKIRLLSVLPLLAVVAMAGRPLAGAEIRVEATVRRSIDGQSRLDRRRCFNVCEGEAGLYDSCPMNEADYLLKELHVSFGRWLGLHKSPSFGGRLKEDPRRPGYVDPASIRAAYAQPGPPDPRMQAVFPDGLDVILHDHVDPHPEIMGKWSYDDGKHWIAENLDAAAEFTVECLRCGYSDYDRPRYFELINEPSWGLLNQPKFHQWYAAVAKAVHRSGLRTLVGGPCMSVSYMYSAAYGGEWSTGLRPFIDAVGGDVDFISFHAYDYINADAPDKQDINTGLPLESVLDLVANYTFLKLGAVKPFACSEHGATGGIFNGPPEGDVPPALRGKAYSRSLCAWYHNNALNGQVMTFIDRPATVLKTVPFTLVRTDRWDPGCPWALYTRQGLTKDGPFHRTDMMHFYELWKDVRGERVVAQCNDPDVLTRAFADGDLVFVCLKNLAGVAKPTKFVFDVPFESVCVSRYYRQGDSGRLETDVPLDDLKDFILHRDETAIVKVRYPAALKPAAEVDETTYYGNRVTVPIQAGVPIQFSVPAAKGARARYATLRVGVSRPGGLSHHPTVTFNGRNLRVPSAASEEKRRDSLATTETISVPVSLLRATNVVGVRFPDAGGAVGAAVLVVAHEKQPVKSFVSACVCGRPAVLYPSHAERIAAPETSKGDNR